MDFLKDWILWGWELICSLCYTIGEFLLEKLFSTFALFDFYEQNVGASSPNAGGAFGNLLGVVDAYIPFTEAIGLWTLLFTFQLALIVVKWVLKFIPGLGG